VALASNWFVDQGQGSVLVRLAASVGDDHLSTARVRGSVDILFPGELPPAGAPLLVVHQDDRGVSLSLDMHGIVSFTPDRSRFRHAVSVPPTATGAPCFDAHFQIIGMLTESGTAASMNEAMTIAAILQSMKERGTDRLLVTPAV
jgi:hypothetical protein